MTAYELRISDLSSDVCSSDLTIGGYVKQFQVIPDMQRLAALGMDLTALAQALEQNNVGVGAGVVDRGGEGLAVRSDARIRNIGELAGTVIATREGVPIRLDQEIGRAHV